MRQHALLVLAIALSFTNAVAEERADQDSRFINVAARFRDVHVEAGSKREFATDLYFIRERNRIEIASEDHAEVWSRDDRGETSWRRVFHSDRKTVEYTAGQLRTENRSPDWNTLNTLFDTDRLTKLGRIGLVRVFDRQAVRYRGTIGDETIELIWLEAEMIPARIERKGAFGVQTLVLSELRETRDPSWPAAETVQTDAYEQLDGADLGDREYDAFVARLLHADAVRTGHPKHAH